MKGVSSVLEFPVLYGLSSFIIICAYIYIKVAASEFPDIRHFVCNKIVSGFVSIVVFLRALDWRGLKCGD